MNALEQILHRRSIRRYRPDLPTRAEIEKITEAGTYAASGMNEQAAIILAVTDPEIVKLLSTVNAEIKGVSGDPFYGAPVVLVVLASSSRLTRVEDGSLVIGNMMLAAHSLGIGSCWIHRAKETFEKPEWKAWLRTLGIQGSYVGVGNCVLGYPDMEYPAAPPRKENRVFYIR